jgi:hypothetical protein
MRMTKHDQQLLEDIDKLLIPGTYREAHHYLAAPTPGSAPPRCWARAPPRT